MKITLLCSNKNHPINDYLKNWIKEQKNIHDVELIQEKEKLIGGNILFLISCSEIVSVREREKYDTCLVLHASNLPDGKGWSPHIWELIQGAEFITLSLLEVEDKIDSGKIWKKMQIFIPKNAIWNEINHLLFSAEIEMVNFAIKNYGSIIPKPQVEKGNTIYYRKRKPEDSLLNINKTIEEQFDLLRVCDPVRFPAYFDYLGYRYILKLEKIHDK